MKRYTPEMVAQWSDEQLDCIEDMLRCETYDAWYWDYPLDEVFVHNYQIVKTEIQRRADKLFKEWFSEEYEQKNIHENNEEE